MVFHWATFRSGCVYLSFPGRFPHVSVTHTQKWCQSFAESGVMGRRFLDSMAAVGVAALSYSI